MNAMPQQADFWFDVGSLQEIPVRADRLTLTGALNQIPTELLFDNGVLVEQRLGPQSYDALAEWLGIAVTRRAGARD